MVPSPSSPEPLEPQHSTPPSSVIPHVWKYPADIDVRLDETAAAAPGFPARQAIKIANAIRNENRGFRNRGISGDIDAPDRSVEGHATPLSHQPQAL